MWWLRHQCVGKTKSASETAVRLAFEKHFSDVAVNYRIRVIWRGVHSSKATEVVLDEISAVDKLGRLAR